MKKILSTLFVGALFGSLVLTGQTADASLKGDPMDNRTPAGRAFQREKGKHCLNSAGGTIFSKAKITAHTEGESNTVNARSGGNGAVVR